MAMMITGIASALAATGPATASPRARAAAAERLPERPRTPDTVRLPYTAGKVYGVRLVPGAPFALELPSGESAKNIWYDNRWWAAESTASSGRVFLRALGSTDVIGRVGFVHIETEPSDLRISLRVEAVHDDAEVPAALEIGLEGTALNDPTKRQIRKAVDREMVYVQAQAQEKARAEFEAWRRRTITNVRTNYEWGGDFKVERVVDDGVQTFISIPNATDRAVIQFVDKSGKPGLVNYELENGTYTVQNKVLRPGEKFRLVLGKQQAWVGLK
jgi:hypothetical protein